MSNRPPRRKESASSVTPDVEALIEKARLNQEVELNLSGIGLTELPESIGELTQLKRLVLAYNDLSVLPEFVGQLSQLEELDLMTNRLTALPDGLRWLTQLKSLSLDSNHLESLPEFIGGMSQLQGLYLDYNQLTKLPESVGRLVSLSVLSLTGNKLMALPESIGSLTNLSILYLNNNQLTELPESLKNLKSLKRLYLHGNDALGLPAEVLGPLWHQLGKLAEPAEILEYYFRSRGWGRRPLNEAKLILVGRGAVGKTSVVNRLVHGKFERDERKTEGIRITKWGIKLHQREDVRLNVWDFGGQEIMHATHQFFLTERGVYLLVLNGRDGMEETDADYWLKLVESFGGDESPVIVVLNKIKEHPFDVNRRGLQQKYPFVREFVRTDCEDGTGIEELREAVERETDRLKHLRDAFPASWFQIKDKLPKIEKNFLTFEEYRGVCAEHGERDPEAQELLAGYLHRLGIALNYKEDPRLRDTHVLNPHWVTNGIYKIINAEKLEKQKGEIKLGDLSAILDRREYPSHMHRFLFDLMKKFELCFSFPEDDCQYLIPQLLDKQEPEATAEFKPEECLNFEYHYPVLPEGLLPRFVVRTHVLSEELPRWRSGVILKFQGNRALVKGDAQDKKVFISIAGPPAGRRRMLAVIRSEFERIHRDIRNLQPREMVPVPGRPKLVVPYEKLEALEQSGISKFHEVADGEAVELKVLELLNGVDLEGTRGKARAPGEGRGAVRVFLSYSHKDDGLRLELEKHLTPLRRQGLIELWSDREIDAGSEWDREISERLERANVVLLLVSADFINSFYVWEKEMSRALERHAKREALVIPVIVRDVNWRSAPFASLQALPMNAQPVTLWEDRDSAWRNVSEEIEKVVKRVWLGSLRQDDYRLG